MIKVPQTSPAGLHDLRQALADCISAAVLPNSPNAQIHNNWAMQYSIEETMEYISYAGMIHAWMIVIDEIVPFDKGIGGRVGGGGLEIPLNVKIFGFIGYEYGTDQLSPLSVLERDCLSIIKTIYLNEIDLGDPNLSENLHDVGLLEFEQLETRSFGSGNDVIVAEGQLPVTWYENIME